MVSNFMVPQAAGYSQYLLMVDFKLTPSDRQQRFDPFGNFNIYNRNLIFFRTCNKHINYTQQQQCLAYFSIALKKS